jgi:parallel beta-helix repeat protein
MFRDLLAAVLRPRVPRRTNRFVPRLEGFEDRTVPATFNVAAGGSIQAAINSAAAASDGNDTINVAAGTYTGNLVIPNAPGLTNLVIQTTGSPSSEGKMAVIKASSGAVITINGEPNVTIQFVKIDGTGTQANQGVYLINNGSATIQHDFIRNISPSSGEGIGIRVGRFQGTPVPGGSVTVSGDTITGYADAGIVVTNNSAGTVSGNTVTGDSTNTRYQNGIEFSFGATGSITSNTVTANGKRNSTNGSAGILLFDAGAGVTVGSNTVQANDLGISVYGSTNNANVSGNQASGNFDYGIGFDGDAGNGFPKGATVSNNTSFNNKVAGGAVNADGFFFFGLQSATGFTVMITQNSSYGNDSDGYYFESVQVLNSGTFSMSNNTTFSGTTGNGQNGIEVVASSGMTVSNNNVKFNKQNGILMDASTSGNTIANNTITNNHVAGSQYFDANDQSGTSTTVANHWTNNTIGTKNKSVIQ